MDSLVTAQRELARCVTLAEAAALPRRLSEKLLTPEINPMAGVVVQIDIGISTQTASRPVFVAPLGLNPYNINQ
jgi:hypothetical protein